MERKHFRSYEKNSNSISVINNLIIYKLSSQMIECMSRRKLISFYIHIFFADTTSTHFRKKRTVYKG